MKVSHAKTNISTWVCVLQIYIDGLKTKISTSSLLFQLGLDTKGGPFFVPKLSAPSGSGGDFSGTAAHGPGLDSKLQAMRLEHSSVVQSWHILERKLRKKIGREKVKRHGKNGKGRI